MLHASHLHQLHAGSRSGNWGRLGSGWSPPAWPSSNRLAACTSSLPLRILCGPMPSSSEFQVQEQTSNVCATLCAALHYKSVLLWMFHGAGRARQIASLCMASWMSCLALHHHAKSEDTFVCARRPERAGGGIIHKQLQCLRASCAQLLLDSKYITQPVLLAEASVCLQMHSTVLLLKICHWAQIPRLISQPPYPAAQANRSIQSNDCFAVLSE